MADRMTREEAQQAAINALAEAGGEAEYADLLVDLQMRGHVAAVRELRNMKQRGLIAMRLVVGDDGNLRHIVSLPEPDFPF